VPRPRSRLRRFDSSSRRRPSEIACGNKMPTLPLKPRFSLRADTTSGDNPRTNTLGTFNALFPIGNYFGILQDTGPGPINFIDVQPRIETVFPHNLSVMTVLLPLLARELTRRRVRPFCTMANRPACLSSVRLRNLLCRPVSPANDAGKQSQLCIGLGRIQVLGRGEGFVKGR
jgi:hypothetical protein